MSLFLLRGRAVLLSWAGCSRQRIAEAAGRRPLEKKLRTQKGPLFGVSNFTVGVPRGLLCGFQDRSARAICFCFFRRGLPGEPLPAALAVIDCPNLLPDSV